MRAAAIAALAAFVAAVLAPGAAAGARAEPTAPDPRGFHVAVFGFRSLLESTSATVESIPGSVFVEERGGGATLVLGWGFTPSFCLRGNLGGAGHLTTDDDVTFAYSSGTIEGQYLFRDPSDVRPYVFGGVGGMMIRARTDAFDYETRGPGLVFGAGVLVFATERFSIDFGGRIDLVNWNEESAIARRGGTEATLTEPIERDGRAGRWGMGVGWWF